jgi:hypothetical protein
LFANNSAGLLGLGVVCVIGAGFFAFAPTSRAISR